MCVLLIVYQINATFKNSTYTLKISLETAGAIGWNDVSFHGSDQIPTPNIDSLGYHGVILNRHYVQPFCTPSRAALMTGRYPLRTGLHDALSPTDKVGLPLSERLLPQYLKHLGYKNHLIGKWHLGYYRREFCPLERGFDNHFGYWGGGISYYDHIDEDPHPLNQYKYSFSGHDMRRNYTSAWDVVGQYATDLFTREAVNVIENHPLEEPMFLYLAHLAPHAGNKGKYLEAPQEEINRFSYISDPNRRTYAAMVSKLDQSIGTVVSALDKKNMLQNSIIVFLSDNGAVNLGVYSNWGSNYPWKGQKSNLWEGAVRTPALIWSPLIDRPSRVSYELMHVTDWLPTLLSAAGCNMKLMSIDGMNQWPMISGGYPSSRKGLVVDVDLDWKMNSLIFNNFKYIKGPNTPSGGLEENTFLGVHEALSGRGPHCGKEEVSKCPAWKALEKHSRNSNLLYNIKELRREATVKCTHDFYNVIDCTITPCLFNLQHDPCEQENVAQLYPEVLRNFEKQLEMYKEITIPSTLSNKDPASNPEYFNGTWSIWEHSIFPSHMIHHHLMNKKY